MRSYGLQNEIAYKLGLQIGEQVLSLLRCRISTCNEVALRANTLRLQYGEGGEHSVLSVAVGGAGMFACSLREYNLMEVNPLLVLLYILTQNVGWFARRLQHDGCRVSIRLSCATVCRYEAERSQRTNLRVEHGLRHCFHLVNERERTIVAHEDVELVKFTRQRVGVATKVVRKLAGCLVLRVPQEIAYASGDVYGRKQSFEST